MAALGRGRTRNMTGQAPLIVAAPLATTTSEGMWFFLPRERVQFSLRRFPRAHGEVYGALEGVSRCVLHRIRPNHPTNVSRQPSWHSGLRNGINASRRATTVSKRGPPTGNSVPSVAPIEQRMVRVAAPPGPHQEPTLVHVVAERCRRGTLVRGGTAPGATLAGQGFSCRTRRACGGPG